MNVLICWRVEDLSTPHKESIRGRYCSKCNKELWVMKSNTKLEVLFLCHDCGQDFVEENSQKKEPVVLLPASAAHVFKGNLKNLEMAVKKLCIDLDSPIQSL